MRTKRTCLVCREIRGAFFCDGWTYGQMWEDIEEQLFDVFNEACIAKLATTAAKTELRDRWIAWKFE